MPTAGSRFRVRQDLTSLPRVEDEWTFLYVQHRKIHQDAFGIQLVTEQGAVQVPLAQFNVLLIGPGVSITSAAVTALADHGCSILWVGENGVRFYASGHPKTHDASNLHKQAQVWADPVERVKVVRRMYVLRYGETFPESSEIAVLRGYEGGRVKQAYLDAATKWGIDWKGRHYKLGNGDVTDLVNRCISVAASCLYGLCHAAIVAVGFSSALGFIHKVDMRSFVWDIADMYRESVTIPIAFGVAAQCTMETAEGATRRACREVFKKIKLLERIVPDTYEVLGLTRVGAKFVDFSAWDSLKFKTV